ncbi:tetratricopeptide repeat protein [uncultured Fibrella sp.]|uniref:tetratricopeptide repeat protein n=1 Tax=uncultured Fibrella sp. TaxID=1284596 RepID=UPI0035CAFAF6
MLIPATYLSNATEDGKLQPVNYNCLGDILRYILILLVVATLASCSSGDRRLSRIPPLPQASDSAQTANTLRALGRAINQSSSATAYAKRAMLLLSVGRIAEAQDDIDEAISRNNSTGFFFLVRAQIMRALKKPERAFEDAQRAEILGINSPELFTLIGDVLQQQAQYPKAQLYIAKALQMAPYDGEAHFYSGLMAAKQGDTVQALAQYQQALQLKPRFLPTYNQLTAVHRSLGDLNTALAYNEKAMQYFPINAELLFQRGMIYQYAGRADSALIAYQRTVSMQPDYVQAYFQAGLIFDRFRNYAAALINFEQVQKRKPTFPRIDFYVGHGAEMTYQWDRALAQYTTALQKDPTDPAAQAGLWRVQRRQQANASYTDYLLNPTSPETGLLQGTRTPGGRTLDTSRIRIAPIQPRTRIRSMNDSTFKVKQID